MSMPYRVLYAVILSGCFIATVRGASLLQPVSFPQTATDTTMVDRMENKRIGYEPFKDKSAYTTITLETEEQALQRQLDSLERQRQVDKAVMSKAEFCDKYPLDDSCPQHPGLEEEIFAIGNRPKPQQPAPTTNNAATGTGGTGATPAPAQPSPSTPSRPGTAPATTTALSATDNRTRGGPCTPSAHSDNYTNKILTSGKYESIDPAFEKTMVQIFRLEGECGGHPNDSGGYTCYGFAQRYNPDIDVRNLTRAGAEDRTYTRYYTANGIEKLPDSIRGDVLRGVFGSGIYGVQQLQKVLNVPTTRDGKVSDALVRAAMEYEGDLHNAYWDNMQQYYRNLVQRRPKDKVFLKGWMNGVKLMRENGCHVVPTRPLTR